MGKQTHFSSQFAAMGKASSLRQVQEGALDGLAFFTFAVGIGLVTFSNALFPSYTHGNLIGMLLILSAAITAYLRESRYGLARWLLTGSWFLGVLGATVWLADLRVAYLFVLPGLAAALFIHLAAGAAIGLAANAALLWTVQVNRLPWNPGDLLVFNFLYWTALSIAYFLQRSMSVLVETSLSSYQQGRIELEAARDRQGELGSALKDLAEANQQMARLNQILNTARYQAEEGERVKTEFVANVSHELRTPLNMIIGYSEMILNMPAAYGKRLPQALVADIAAIHRNSEHLIHLINDVLDISQIEVKRMALNKEWLVLGEVIAEAVSAIQPLLTSKQLYCHVELCPEPLVLFGDRTRLRQVLLNLLSNAARYTDKGGLTITTECEDNEIRVLVSDTGPGISEQDLPKLFEPFRQLDGSLRRRQNGSGLGLNISRQFVELHGGKIGVYSKLGEGSTFWFTLPPSPQPVAIPGFGRWLSSEYEQRPHEHNQPRQQLLPRVVILEAGEALQNGAQRYLDDVAVEAAATPEEAARLLSSPAQVAIVRGATPEQTAEWVKHIAGSPFPTPIIGCLLPGEQGGIGLPVRAYLVKPVTSSQLLTAVESLDVPVDSILLVDDDVEALRLFTRVLTKGPRRNRVLQASSGSEALALLRSRPIDLLILDLVMPGMDGFALLEEKEKDEVLRAIPTIVLSATDPSGQPFVASSLLLTRSGGLSLPELLRCALLVSDILTIPRQNTL
jgi:signal transduction histidine kinase/CheY-like chemotaxis protein